MMAVLMFTRVIAFIVVAAAIAAGVYLLCKAIAKLLHNRSEYYNIEKLDEAEILARKYERKGKP